MELNTAGSAVDGSGVGEVGDDAVAEAKKEEDNNKNKSEAVSVYQHKYTGIWDSIPISDPKTSSPKGFITTASPFACEIGLKV